MKCCFISEKSSVEVIGGICELGGDLYLAGVQIPNHPTQKCRTDSEQSHPLFHSPHSRLEHSSWICWALLTPEGWTGCVLLVGKPGSINEACKNIWYFLWDEIKDLYISLFFLPFITLSNKGLLLGPFLEHGAPDVCKYLNSLSFSYVWTLDLHGSCLFVYQILIIFHRK